MAGRSRYEPSSSPFVSKLYWPTGSGLAMAKDHGGLLIGWNDCNFVANVVAIVPGSDLDSLDLALQRLSTNPSLSKLWEHCSGPPIVIGNCTRSASPSSAHLEGRRRAADFWITVDVSADRPVLTSVFCCGFLYRTASQVLLYDPPRDRCTYLCDAPFTFDWTAVFAQPGDDGSVTDLQLVLRQISSAQEIQEELIAALESFAVESALNDTTGDVGLRRRQQPAAPHPIASLKPVRTRPGALFRGFVHLTHLLLLLWRIGCHVALVLANCPLPMLIGGRRLKDRSAVFRQLDRRIGELTQWPEMWVRMRSVDWHPKAYVNASMISIMSSISQFLVDILAGVIVGYLLRAHSDAVLETVHNAGQILHVDVLRRQVIWLMGLPAGMKLNFSLDQSLGSMVLYGIDFWNAITTVLTPLESHIIATISLIAGFGLSIAVACAIDLLSMMTTHVLFVHTAFSRLYSLSLSALSALSKLFSGKKHNILQRRIDSCHFDVDQLLLGTILFTLIFFLFPTVAIYYLFFAIVRFLIMLVEAGLHLSMAALNHFPFFELAIFLFDRRRLPSGIRLEVLQPVNQSCVYLMVHSRCIELATVFSQCFCNMQSLLNQYSLTESLRCLVYGLPIPPHRLDTSDDDGDIIMDFSPGVTGFWFFLKTHLDAQ